MAVYLIADISIKNVKEFMEYSAKIPEFIDKHQGRYVVKGEKPRSIEGDWKPKRMVIIEFPSKEHADNFVNDPHASGLFELRQKAADSNTVIVNGC